MQPYFNHHRSMMVPLSVPISNRVARAPSAALADRMSYGSSLLQLIVREQRQLIPAWRYTVR